MLIDNCKQRNVVYSVSSLLDSFRSVLSIERVLASREVLRLFHDDGDYSEEIRGNEWRVDRINCRKRAE